MAQISPELQRRYGFMIGSIPGEIRKAIDSEELADRVVMADDLIRKSQEARTPADRKMLGEQAQRVLGARPRRETEQIVVAKMAKAKVIGDPGQRAGLERQAREELALNPPAVRRKGSKSTPVAKASAEPDASGLIALYDATGNLVYVGNPEDLTPLVDPADAGAGVAKARRQTRPRPGKAG